MAINQHSRDDKKEAMWKHHSPCAICDYYRIAAISVCGFTKSDNRFLPENAYGLKLDADNVLTMGGEERQ